jgi:hypothetical protein
MTKRTAERPNRYHVFLRRLHAGGRTNMYGAIPYLAAAFGCDRAEAFRIVCEWIDLQDAAALAADSAAPRPKPLAHAHAHARGAAPSREAPSREAPSLFDAPPPPPAARNAAPAKASKKSKRHPVAKKRSRRKAA